MKKLYRNAGTSENTLEAYSTCQSCSMCTIICLCNCFITTLSSLETGAQPTGNKTQSQGTLMRASTWTP